MSWPTQSRDTIRTEILAGITSFLATMYIIVVNPSILAQTGMPFAAVLTATVLVSGFSSVAMGLYAKNPIVVAPGMGINAFFTFSMVLGMKIPVPTALGAVFWSGVIALVLSLFSIRTKIIEAIPRQVRYGVAVGIGLFISLIGFLNGGLVAANPATTIGQAPFGAANLTFLAGLAVTTVLVARRFKGALILGIVATTLLAIPVGRLYGETPLVTWQGIVATPDFSLVGAVDLVGSLKFALWPTIFAMFFVDMFDSLSTFMGIAEAGNLLDESGEPRRIKESLIVDSAATMLSGLLGTSSATSYIESAAGIEQGGRTGLTAVVAGLLFLPFMVLWPLLSMVPKIATAPALVMVGVFMMLPVTQIRWRQLDEAIPAFLAMVLIPFTYSITYGIVWGFISWTLMKVVKGRWREVPAMLWVVDVLAVLALISSS